MRRRRRRLQVSLFPFLAVLLCVLGALILLLLVLDQKARQSVAEEAERKAAEASSAAGDAERELRQRLQALLNVRDDWAAKAGKLKDEHRRQLQHLERKNQDVLALQQQTKWEQAQLTHDQRLPLQMREQSAAVEKQRAEVQAGISQLEEQIRALEEMVRKLQEKRNQPKPPVYSLVPYKGRQGTSRPPVYVECVDDYAVFRPGIERFSNSEIRTGPRFAGVVQERFAQMAQGTQLSQGDDPYVLLLIRPSGIQVYYSVLRALQNSKVEIGYEFLAEDWALDLTTPAPERSAERNPIASLENRGVEDSAPAAHSSSAGATANPASSSLANRSTSRQSPKAVRSGSTTPPAGDSPWTAPPRAILSAPQAASREGSSGAIQKSGREGSSARDKNQPEGRPGGLDRGSEPRELVLSPGEGDRAKPTFLKPIFSNPASQATPAAPPSPSGKAAGSKPDARSDRDRVAPEDRHSAPNEEGQSTARLPSDGRIAEKARAMDRPRGLKPGNLSRSISSDWVIVIECSGTAISIQGHPPAIEPAALTGARGDNPLARGIQEIIEVRQKKRPDLQPKLKYLIHADGLRNYYLASGALQALKLPATWEAADEKTKEDAKEGGPSREP